MKAIFGFCLFFLTCLGLFITPAHASNLPNIPLPAPDCILPPTNLHGHQTSNRFATQKDLINVIKWDPPASGTAPVAYNIYRDANLTKLLEIIPAHHHKLKFSDHDRKENDKDSYFIVSIDAAGNQSLPIGIIFKGPKTKIVEFKEKLVAIEVTPVDPSVEIGFEIQFTATGIFSDNTTKDLTNQVVWLSSNGTVASISNEPSTKGLATGLAGGTSEIQASLRCVSGSTTLTVTEGELLSIEVTPAIPSVPAGINQQFTATGLFSDGTTENLTNEVVWSSSNAAVATISNTPGSQGLAAALSAGTTEIQATHQGISGSTTLTVTSALLQRIEVDPVNPKIEAGNTQQFAAIGIFSNGDEEVLTNQVTWLSSNPAIAVISNDPNSKGLATGVSVGSVTITAALNGVQGTTILDVGNAVLVSIGVTPPNPVIPELTTIQFTATGVYSDQTTPDLTENVTWESSDTSIAQISNDPNSKGIAKGLKPGTVQISALFNGVIGTATLTVNAAQLVSIQVEPIMPAPLPKGLTQQFTATGTYNNQTTKDITTAVTWTSSNDSIAEISNAAGSQGLAKAIGVGTATITATLNGIQGTRDLQVVNPLLVSIQVTPVDPSIPKGTFQKFTAIGTYGDGSMQNLTTQVLWSSSSITVATISNKPGDDGLVEALSPGTTTISASLGAVSGSTTLTVTPAVLTQIQVTPTDPEVIKGLKQQFIATGIYSDHSKADITAQVAWTSSNPAIAEISNAQGSKGLATTFKVGTTTITAAASDGTGITGSTSLIVNAAALVSIQVLPSNVSIPAGMSVNYTATGTYTDGLTQDLTTIVDWTSSATGIAEISNVPGSQGKATGISPGVTTITATFTGISGSTGLTITSATLESIAVTPNPASVAKGSKLQFTATGTFSDSSTEDITQDVTWSSSNEAVAQISNAAGSQGQATAIATGDTTITALLMGISGSSTLTVTPAVLSSIDVTPPSTSVIKTQSTQFTATGHYSDGSTQNLTTAVTWTSSDITIAAISNAAGSEGKATGVNPGTVTITATLAAISGTATLTVAACPGITITTASKLPDAVIFQPYNEGQGVQLQTSGGLAPITFELINAIDSRTRFPPGITLSSSGFISGTPDDVSSRFLNLTIRAKSGCGSITEKTFSMEYFSIPH